MVDIDRSDRVRQYIRTYTYSTCKRIPLRGKYQPLRLRALLPLASFFKIQNEVEESHAHALHINFFSLSISIFEPFVLDKSPLCSVSEVGRCLHLI